MSVCYHRAMLQADLHCHSTASDGALAPADVVRRAAAFGVELLALTDHDEVAGLAEARAEAAVLGLRFVNGVEVSVSWQDTTIHVVGLRVDPLEDGLVAGLASVRAGRHERARKMAEQFERIGIPGMLEGASRHAKNPALIGRTHFARHLLERGIVPRLQAAFDHYLVRGRPGYVGHQWATLAQAVDWISGAGGIAVLAHPGRYRLSGDALGALCREFRAAGGRGVEVVSGADDPARIRDWARLAREHGFLASRASDFHAPAEGHAELGGVAALPEDLTPVWTEL
jgi:hypothetical protein